MPVNLADPGHAYAPTPAVQIALLAARAWRRAILGWTDIHATVTMAHVGGVRMSASNPRAASGFLYCLGIMCLLQPASTQAMVSGNNAMPSVRHWVVTQAQTPPLLPSLVLPPDATAGPPTFVAFMRMGDSAMLRGNILQARQLYERATAVHPASTAALLAAGKTYDPNILASLGSSSFADPAMARRWYGRARILGDPAAAELLARLP